MGRSCAVLSCYGTRTSVSLHGFPLSKPHLLKKWIDITGRKNWTPTKHSRLCSNHFTLDQFYPYRGEAKNKRYRELKRDAVPSTSNAVTWEHEKEKLTADGPSWKKQSISLDSTPQILASWSESSSLVNCDAQSSLNTTCTLLSTSTDNLQSITPDSILQTSPSCSESAALINCDVESSQNTTSTSFSPLIVDVQSITPDISLQTSPSCSESAALIKCEVESSPITTCTSFSSSTDDVQFSSEDVEAYLPSVISDVQSSSSPGASVTVQCQENCKAKQNPSKMQQRISKLSRRIKTLQQNLRRKEVKIKSLKVLINNLKKKRQPDDLTSVLESQFSGFPLEICLNSLRNENTSKPARSYTETMKQFALTIYFYSPKAYQYLRKLFPLPHPSRIRSWVSKLNCEEGLNQEVFQDLQSSISSRPPQFTGCDPADEVT